MITPLECDLITFLCSQLKLYSDVPDGTASPERIAAEAQYLTVLRMSLGVLSLIASNVDKDNE